MCQRLDAFYGSDFGITEISNAGDFKRSHYRMKIIIKLKSILCN